MKKHEALDRGYCNHCAAASTGRQLCGVTTADQIFCILDVETIERWRKEHALDAEPIRRPLKKK